MKILAASTRSGRRARVTRFDDEAFNFDLLLGGLFRVGSLDHLYAEVEGGCSFYTEAPHRRERAGHRSAPELGHPLGSSRRNCSGPGSSITSKRAARTEKFVPALYEESRRTSR